MATTVADALAMAYLQRSLLKRSSLPIFPILLLLVISLPVALAHGGYSDEGADAATDTPNLRAKSLILVKIYCLIIVFFTTFVAGVSPFFYRWNQSFLVLGTQFAAGVFLGAAMIHFLGDANKGFEELTKKTYPFAFMLTCAGYLLTMLADVIIQYIFAKGGNICKVDVEMAVTKVPPAVNNEDDAACKHDNGAITHETRNFVAATQLAKTASYGDTILLILALCFHSIFEGIAIGISDTAYDAWRAMWTISLHKIFAAIAMGIALLRMIPNRPLFQTLLYSFAFGISSPIGIAIGIIIDATTQGHVADWMYAIGMGIACGVFIYVAINHLIAKGYVPTCRVQVDTPFYRFLAVTLGVGVLAVVMIWD